MNSPSLSRIHYEWTWCFANKLWINYLLREYTMNSLFIFRLPYEFTWCFADSLWIYCLYREFSKNSRGVSLILYEFSWCFSNILRIHYLVREFTNNSILFSRIFYLFTILIADSSRNHLVEFYFWWAARMIHTLFEALISTHSLTRWLILAYIDIQSEVIFGPLTDEMSHSRCSAEIELN